MNMVRNKDHNENLPHRVNAIISLASFLMPCNSLFQLLPQKKYIMAVHGFEEENITVLMDDGEHELPTKDNIMSAYRKVVAESEAGDAIFLHYSGHGTKLRDEDGDEDDGYDEALVPLDFQEGGGMIRDDDLYDTLIEPLAQGVHVVSLVSCGGGMRQKVTSTYGDFSPGLEFSVGRWTAATVEPF
jgi:hypothetical protein